MSKVELRQIIKRTIQELDESQKLEKSRNISKQLASFLLDQNYIHRKIGGFYPLDDEVNWLLESPISENANLAFPLMYGDSQMSFRLCAVKDLELKRAYGREFREPAESCDEVSPEVIIVPAMAFDRSGNRLGRGKGFYDKFLSNRDDAKMSKDIGTIKIGICFHEQLVEKVPVDDHDIPVDFIITDKEFVKVSNRREE